VKAFAFVCALILVVPGGALPPPGSPVLVELFTSEGCSSCPAADALLSRILASQPVADADIIALEFHVDYWDRLGWKDPFSSAAFTKRQRDYSRVFGADRVYTPQMVIDGATELVGSDEAAALAAIRKAVAQPHLDLRVAGSRHGTQSVRMSVDAPAAVAGGEPIDVVVALVEDGLTSSVGRGENKGRTLTHSAVVRRHQVIGALEREPFVGEGEWRLNPAWKPAHLRLVAFLQGRRTQRVYGSAATGQFAPAR
jgi:hypothetical protein